MEQIVFLDVETTGLKPKTDYMLEIAVLIVGARQLDVRGSGSWVIKYELDGKRLLSHDLLDEVCADQVVRTMHRENRLLDECDGDSAVPLEEAEQSVLDLLDSVVVGSPRLVIGGYSPQFDREVVKNNMPRLFARLSHRMVDVSTFRECAKVWNAGLISEEKPHTQDDLRTNHRAMADCLDAWAALRKYHAWWTR